MEGRNMNIQTNEWLMAELDRKNAEIGLLKANIDTLNRIVDACRKEIEHLSELLDLEKSND